MKIARFIKHNNIESRITIRLSSMKITLRRIENQDEIIHSFSFKNWRRKQNCQLKDEEISSCVLQLSTRRLSRVIFNDRIRIKRRNVSFHWDIFIHDQLRIRITNEYRFNWLYQVSEEKTCKKKSARHNWSHEEHLWFY